jgi:hypothetical protein
MHRLSESQYRHYFVVCEFFTDKIGQHFWIGANDIDIEDDWIWESDKSKLLFSDWHVGERIMVVKIVAI